MNGYSSSLVPYNDTDSDSENSPVQSTTTTSSAVSKINKESTPLINGKDLISRIQKSSIQFKPRQLPNGIALPSTNGVKVPNSVKENTVIVIKNDSSIVKPTSLVASDNAADSRTCKNSPDEGQSKCPGAQVLSIEHVTSTTTDEGWVVSDASNHGTSDTSSNTSSSSNKSLHKFTVTDKSESSSHISKHDKKEIVSLPYGWKVTSSTNMKKSHSEDSRVNVGADTADSSSLQSCPTTSDRVVKAPTHHRKKLFGFFPCLSGVQSPSVSPEDERRSFVSDATSSQQSEDSLFKRFREEEEKDGASKKHRQEHLKNGAIPSINGSSNKICNDNSKNDKLYIKKLNTTNKSNVNSSNDSEGNFSYGESERRPKTMTGSSNGVTNGCDTGERTSDCECDSSVVPRVAPVINKISWDQHTRGDLLYTLSSHREGRGGAKHAPATKGPIWTAADCATDDTAQQLLASRSFTFGTKG